VGGRDDVPNNKPEKDWCSIIPSKDMLPKTYRPSTRFHFLKISLLNMVILQDQDPNKGNLGDQTISKLWKEPMNVITEFRSTLLAILNLLLGIFNNHQQI
jgi:hypothetical protein